MHRLLSIALKIQRRSFRGSWNARWDQLTMRLFEGAKIHLSSHRRKCQMLHNQILICVNRIRFWGLCAPLGRVKLMRKSNQAFSSDIKYVQSLVCSSPKQSNGFHDTSLLHHPFESRIGRAASQYPMCLACNSDAMISFAAMIVSQVNT